jgi:two-component system, cell cycle response regulator
MRILIADDDATSRVVLKAIVAKLGHECVVANDGTSAWAQLSSAGIDVLLTDWMMPGVDGPELCARVRDELGDRYIYIVLITKLGHAEHVLEGMGAGADDYLIKPVDPFAVQTRLVAAERVIALHRQLTDFGTQLEDANHRLLERSLTDALTGLGNRRRMEEDLERTHVRSLRGERTYGVALFDIDHFKLYNDHYGHLAGDDVLREVAQSLDHATRAGDQLYRYGGEEFLLLFHDATGDDAATAASRILEAVTDAAIPHAHRPTNPSVVTVSGGICCWTPGSDLSATELIHHADGALYRAKAAGRNRVELAAITHRARLSAILP